MPLNSCAVSCAVFVALLAPGAASGSSFNVLTFESGFSNHAYGSRELGMSAVLDSDRDGTPDIAVPDSSRHTLVLLSLEDSRYRELHRVAHSSQIVSGIHAVDLNGDGMPELAYVLADGSLVVVILSSMEGGPG